MKISRIIVFVLLSIFLLPLYHQFARADFNNDTIESSPMWQVWPTTLAIILVEFPDVTHTYFDTSGVQHTFEENYSWQDFYNMLASDGSYTGSSPDGETVFGSLRDYFWNMSGGTYRPNIEILNSKTANNPDLPPQWYMMPHTKQYYADMGESSSFTPLTNDAIALAAANGKNTSTSASRRICVIYAGNRRQGIGAWAYQGGNRYMVFERWTYGSDGYKYEYQNAHFTHIGVHAHEFSHLRNLGHPHYSNRWSVLNDGLKNGPLGSSFGACPAALNPFYRAQDGWITTQPLVNFITRATLNYNSSPNFFVRTVPGTNQSLLVENRQFSSVFDQHLPGATSGLPGGLLIWKHTGGSFASNYAVDLIEADNTELNETQSLITDIFRPDGAYPYHTISDYSTPANLKLSSTSFSHFAVDSFYVNGNTIPVKFITNYWEGTIATNTIWNNSTYVGADVNVASGATLTISSTGVVDLYGNIKASGGVISRQTNSTLNPDLRLMNAAVIKGQYRSLAAAFGDATTSDVLYIASDTTCTGTINFTCNAFIENNANLSFANAAVVLNGFALKATAGTISKGANVTFSPDIRLIHNGNLTGQYPSLAAAFADAQPGDAIHLASDDTLHTAWEIPAGITFKVTNAASLVLEGDLDVAYGATFLVDEHTCIKCYDHIDIQGGTMEVSPGARLEFDHFSKIKVKGILNAEGTVSERIVFTSHNGDWTGICFYEDCNYESSQLRYCEISLADYGVWCNYTSPDVKHCLIHDNDIGFYGYYVDYHQKISDNVFEHNHNYGIAISQGNAPKILRNEITNGYSGAFGMAFWDANFTAYSLIEENEIMGQATGISGIRSDLQFKENVVQNNSSHGIRATNGTWVTMEYPGGANNVIRNNNRPGVYISSSGYGIMGAYMDNSQNSLYGNATYQLQYKGDEPGDPYVLACGNYWGGCPVNPSWIYGNVDYTDPFCFDPNNTLSAPNPNIARTDAAEPALPDETTSTNDSITTAKKAAFQFVARNDLNSAIEQFKWIADNFPETEDASHALVHLNHCYLRLNEKSGLESYLEAVCAKNRENDLVLTARYLLAPGRIRRGERKESLQTYLAISQQTKNAELAADALFNAWQVCFNLLQDVPQAKEIYQTFAEKFGKDNRLVILQLAHAAEDHEKLMRTNEPIADLAKPAAESIEPTPAIITEYQLYPNYPNPFNPHTTIGYQLPEAGIVSLKIYNLAGKLVRTLVESSQTAAYHQVQWDATDDAGNAVAAGIYLCQMQAGVFRQTQRLVLLK